MWDTLKNLVNHMLSDFVKFKYGRYSARWHRRVKQDVPEGNLNYLDKFCSSVII